MRYFVPIILLIFVTACAPTREEADKKLLAACQDAVRALADPADQIDFKKSAFKFAKGHENAALRVVNMSAHFIHDHGMLVEKEYACSFAEQWSAFSYLPEFYNLEKDGQQYGNFDGQGLGDLTDLMKINDAVMKALH